MEKITTIRLSQGLKERIGKIGTKDDSYEDILRRLLDHYIKNRKINSNKI